MISIACARIRALLLAPQTAFRVLAVEMTCNALYQLQIGSVNPRRVLSAGFEMREAQLDYFAIGILGHNSDHWCSIFDHDYQWHPDHAFYPQWRVYYWHTDLDDDHQWISYDLIRTNRILDCYAHLEPVAPHDHELFSLCDFLSDFSRSREQSSGSNDCAGCRILDLRLVG